ncbi:cytokine inducing-glycoprotein [Hirsutella rhossiliensis]|uniref:Cytokine inducing-glycoprotein n=1 Tax=Hirsutella rhossiliensis TaxID=111463 RepID=A0A9P8SM02_9HYPO|nr:cytokine inducing-glycoprotein [Hirsutella rhossiliensis]KAH0966320.1 cytokine inducing-glycoprotein [Hirsutella rhossiliensis]
MQLPKNSLALGLASMLAIATAHYADDKQSKSNPSSASFTDDHMGPAAFMWPPDRVWLGKMDNTAPCGSSAAPGVRTKFPLNGGLVALVAQDDYYDSKISISYSKDPASNNDFSPLVSSTDINDLNPGHTCVKVPDAPERITAGTNATLQIIYRADWDAPHNQTFYACADITFVSASDFVSDSSFCFNATEPGEDDKKADAAGGSKPTANSDNSGSSAGSKLGAGAIAGIVIGSLVGVSSVAAALLLLYRRRQQKQRQLRLARMEENARRDQFPMHKYSSSQNSS